MAYVEVVNRITVSFNIVWIHHHLTIILDQKESCRLSSKANPG